MKEYFDEIKCLTLFKTLSIDYPFLNTRNIGPEGIHRQICGIYDDNTMTNRIVREGV